MHQTVATLAILGLFVLAPGYLDCASTGNISPSNPVFQDAACPENAKLPKDHPEDFPENPDLCVEVVMPNSEKDMLVLAQVPGTSIYEGYLRNEVDVPVVLIDVPSTNKRVINFNTDKIPSCSSFDVNLSTGNVKCLVASFNDQNTTDSGLIRTIEERISSGEIIPLGSSYPNGINVRVLFIFDDNFKNAFDGEDGKSANEHMEEVISIVKNAFKDPTLKREIGTVVNIIGTKVVKPISSRDRLNSQYFDEDRDDEKHDLVAYITHPGASGYAYLATLCDSRDDALKFSSNKAYGSRQCNYYDPPETIDCTPTNRVVLTAELVAHEIGHNLGMDHDFIQEIYDDERRFEYREYKNEDCRGLMDYIDDGVGWSKCSMMDFSNYIVQYPRCMKENSPINPGPEITTPESGSCTDGQWKCENGQCIRESWLNDNECDCEDGSDEREGVCNPGPEITTPESGLCMNGEWKCENGQCIPESWLNDNECDCDDGSDEREGVCNSDQCQNGEWKCNSGECILESWKCDGYRDCSDDSDEEEGCSDSSLCSDNEWRCDNGECIRAMWYDDNECDCKDGSDEPKMQCDVQTKA